MTAADIYYQDILALADQPPGMLKPHEVAILQKHAKATATPDAIVMRVIESYAARSQAGMIKFGQSMGDNPEGFRHWLINMKEEMQDAALYIERSLLNYP